MVTLRVTSRSALTMLDGMEPAGCCATNAATARFGSVKSTSNVIVEGSGAGTDKDTTTGLTVVVVLLPTSNDNRNVEGAHRLFTRRSNFDDKTAEVADVG